MKPILMGKKPSPKKPGSSQKKPKQKRSSDTTIRRGTASDLDPRRRTKVTGPPKRGTASDLDPRKRSTDPKQSNGVDIVANTKTKRKRKKR